MEAIVLSVNESSTNEGRLQRAPICFELKLGECVLLKGSNGSGKSTFLRRLLGLDSGFAAGGRRLHLSQDEIGYLPQSGNTRFFLPLTLSDVIGAESGDAKTEEEIEQIGLLDRSALARMWNSASGGEKQRALLTRVLMRRPRLLILDEPLNHLDGVSRERVLLLLSQFVLNRGGSAPGALLLVSHEQQLHPLNCHQVVEFDSAAGI